MLDPDALIPFVVASAILVAIPGPAVLSIVSTGVARGRGSALASMAGIENGAMFHVLAATLGLSALVASSALAFSVLRYAGAAYLIDRFGLRLVIRNHRFAFCNGGRASPELRTGWPV